MLSGWIGHSWSLFSQSVLRARVAWTSPPNAFKLLLEVKVVHMPSFIKSGSLALYSIDNKQINEENYYIVAEALLYWCVGLFLFFKIVRQIKYLRLFISCLWTDLNNLYRFSIMDKVRLGNQEKEELHP